ncbi:uncharacterized protein LY89DRAFT_600948 [Mollisia scopiformis]|uniref:EthD domain-containing protein n=1 Tax=Mollisia scopiformis TaxID=149040 RepID=A0A132B5X7_MOLSC|nr:uncharacterized protein LY89DRAFT_600948 [Mollisia scopiformis]KUJ07810.1 hypothetical protein LY89DRAFT_600948 [Mollisia scopiformis]
MNINQSLIARHPSLTQEEFCEYWYTKHAPLVVPMFLYSGTQHYEQALLETDLSLQIHGPLTYTTPSASSDLEIQLHHFSGAAAILRRQPSSDNPSPTPKWVQDYYTEVVVIDERKFLVSEAANHYVRVPPETVNGDKKVIIQDGKCLIEVGDEVWKVWREYEARGGMEVEESKARED